jgi:hypothetical protein
MNEPCKTALIEKTKFKYALLFYIEIAPFVIFATVAFALMKFFFNFYVPSLIYIGFCILYFCILEIPIHCQHCPFYSLKRWYLRCPAKYGFPKIGTYNSSP